MTIELIEGDCLEVMPTLASGSIDMILTDLPYGTTRNAWDVVIPFAPMWAEFWRLCPKGAVVLFGAQPFTSALVLSQEHYFKYELIWHKSKSGSAFTAKYRPLAKHENICVFGRGVVPYYPQMVAGAPYSRVRRPGAVNNHKLGLGKNESRTVNEGTRHPESVMFFQQKWRRQDQMHPTQKPVDLCEYLIRTYTKPGDTILSACFGSGTVGVAARNLDRHCIGIEKDPKYFELAERRLWPETVDD